MISGARYTSADNINVNAEVYQILMLINWFHKKAYIEPDLKLYMNPISKCKGVRPDDPQGVIFGGKKYFLWVNYAEICVNGNAVNKLFFCGKK